MKFKGRFGVFMWVITLLILASTVLIVCSRREFDGPAGYLILVMIFVMTSVFALSFALRNHISVSAEKITVCFGPTTVSVSTASVVSLEKVRGIVASNAASSKRIKLTYKKGSVKDFFYIAPKDGDGFIKALCELNPDIVTE